MMTPRPVASFAPLRAVQLEGLPVMHAGLSRDTFVLIDGPRHDLGVRPHVGAGISLSGPIMSWMLVD